MEVAIGHLFDYKFEKNNLTFIGHRFVAIAFDRDNPICELILGGIKIEDYKKDELEQISTLNENYKMQIGFSKNCWLNLTITNLFDDSKSVYDCKSIKFKERYYTEIEAINILNGFKKDNQPIKQYLESIKQKIKTFAYEL